ncbi:ABC transporter permease [Chryseolinea lacunae]|uniref:ABC transporter permease n=1 Tax=Chryseolinea lacunae TaxID=2801331 RepID=A0ABS1KSP9_9BACT|nr:FtsX-like permease family protein [Chryseolinea lacunae]MBL0742343.1 ABC transporter permease [Chryseolinea lacunae]
MIKNYLLVAVRTLLKNKSYVIINALGLGVSLACCLAAYLWVAFNIEFDNFHDDAKVSRIFKVHTHTVEKDGRTPIDFQAPIMLAPVAAGEIAGIERYTRFIHGGGSMRYGDNAFNEGLSFADSTFLDLFDFPLVAGNAKSFKEKNSIFLTEEVAKKYFGNEDPIGKMLTLNFVNNYEMEAMVGGVFKDIPSNNTFGFRVLMRFENYIDYNKLNLDDWSDWRNPSTFFELSAPENAARVAAQFKKYIPHRNEVRTDVVVTSYSLEPFKKKFSQDTIRYGWSNLPIQMAPLIIFSSMALLILLIACFNLTNTSIAMTAKRLKEVGVRKTIGAARKQIVFQFLLETFLTILISLVVGLMMAQLIVPVFTDMWQIRFGLGDLSGLNLFIALLGLVFVTAMVAGIYPALVSSKFKPTVLLKGSVKIKGTNALTHSLVAAQFALSVIVLIAGVIFIQNTKYQDSIRFGYDKDQIITVSLQGERDFEAMEKALVSNPKVLSIGVADGTIGRNPYGTPIRIDTTQYEVQAMGIGKNYFETMGLKVVQGRNLNLDNASDVKEGVVVNRAFVERTGMKDPIDQIIFLHNGKHFIVGVIDNHIDNLYRAKEPEPFVFYAAGKEQYITMVVKTEHADLLETQKSLEKTWKEVFPTRPFESQLQDDVVLANSRELNTNLEKIFIFLTILGGLLSASGIFALASLNIAKRTKEIGIRKSLGASVRSVVTLLNREFVVVLSIAAVLGSVGGYYATNALLGVIYVYHIPVGLAPIVGCAIFIFLVGILTTSSTIMRAAKTNPVETLRSE